MWLRLGSRPTRGIQVSRDSSIRSIRTHVRCCSRRVGGKVVNQLRLGDREICIEEGFGFASREYEGSRQMQERNIHLSSKDRRSRKYCGTAGKSMSTFQHIVLTSFVKSPCVGRSLRSANSISVVMVCENAVSSPALKSGIYEPAVEGPMGPGRVFCGTGRYGYV